MQHKVEVGASRQAWDSKNYSENAGWVHDWGKRVVEFVLLPKPGERILDLGCGNGDVTRLIADAGCNVVGIDSSPEMIETAKSFGVDARLADACRLDFKREFDAVFTNASIHWMRKPRAVVRGAFRSLRKGGRFVGEFGGKGNLKEVVSAMKATFEENPDFGMFHNPWYFPSPVEFGGLLEQSGFRIARIADSRRVVPVEKGIGKFCEIFAKGITRELDAAQKEVFFKSVEKKTRAELYCGRKNLWSVKYVRIGFEALKP